MCNLYSSRRSHEELRRLFEVENKNTSLGNMPALDAIYPKYEAPIVAINKDGERALIRSHWGFLTPNKSKKTGNWIKPLAWNNTRDDKVTSAGLWKESFAARRCLIPGTGYAEATGRNPATYHWFRLKGEDSFAFAGIWKHIKGTIGAEEVDVIAYSMMTTTPNELASQYHNRMPVILEEENYETWLRGTPDDATGLLQPIASEQLEVFGSGEGLRRDPRAEPQ